MKHKNLPREYAWAVVGALLLLQTVAQIPAALAQQAPIRSRQFAGKVRLDEEGHY